MSATQEPNTANVEQPKKKKGKLFLIIGLLIVLLAGGGGGFFFWSKSGAAAEKEEPKARSNKSASKKEAVEDEENEETGKSKKSEKSEKLALLDDALPDDAEVKHVVELQPFIINLADAEAARYLRMTVSLGLGEDGASEKPDPLFLTRVKNAMLAVLTTKKSEEILTIEGKTQLRRELLKAAQAASDAPFVEAIYITDFIVQL